MEEYRDFSQTTLKESEIGEDAKEQEQEQEQQQESPEEKYEREQEDKKMVINYNNNYRIKRDCETHKWP